MSEHEPTTHICDDWISIKLPDWESVIAAQSALSATEHWTEIVPGIDSIAVQFDPALVSPDEAAKIALVQLTNLTHVVGNSRSTVTVPVCYETRAPRNVWPLAGWPVRDNWLRQVQSVSLASKIAFIPSTAPAAGRSSVAHRSACLILRKTSQPCFRPDRIFASNPYRRPHSINGNGKRKSEHHRSKSRPANNFAGRTF